MEEEDDDGEQGKEQQESTANRSPLTPSSPWKMSLRESRAEEIKTEDKEENKEEEGKANRPPLTHSSRWKRLRKGSGPQRCWLGRKKSAPTKNKGKKQRDRPNRLAHFNSSS